MKTKEAVFFILGTSYGYESTWQKVPVKQMHIWFHVNFFRAKAGKAPLSRNSLSRALHQLAAKGKVTKTIWMQPMEGSMWALVEAPNAVAQREP